MSLKDKISQHNANKQIEIEIEGDEQLVRFKKIIGDELFNDSKFDITYRDGFVHLEPKVFNNVSYWNKLNYIPNSFKFWIVNFSHAAIFLNFNSIIELRYYKIPLCEKSLEMDDSFGTKFKVECFIKDHLLDFYSTVDSNIIKNLKSYKKRNN